MFTCSAILTAAVEMLAGKEAARVSRKPDIVADAAYAILCKDSKTFTGQFTVDEDVLRAEGFSQEQIDAYACDPCELLWLLLCCLASQLKHE